MANFDEKMAKADKERNDDISICRDGFLKQGLNGFCGQIARW